MQFQYEEGELYEEVKDRANMSTEIRKPEKFLPKKLIEIV